MKSEIHSFENSVDPDQLASKKRPADQDPHCFAYKLQFIIINQNDEVKICNSFFIFCLFLFDLILYVPSTIFQLNRTGLPRLNQN